MERSLYQSYIGVTDDLKTYWNILDQLKNHNCKTRKDKAECVTSWGRENEGRKKTQ